MPSSKTDHRDNSDRSDHSDSKMSDSDDENDYTVALIDAIRNQYPIDLRDFIMKRFAKESKNLSWDLREVFISLIDYLIDDHEIDIPKKEWESVLLWILDQGLDINHLSDDSGNSLLAGVISMLFKNNITGSSLKYYNEYAPFVVRLLIDMGANPQIANAKNETPLDMLNHYYQKHRVNYSLYSGLNEIKAILENLQLIEHKKLQKKVADMEAQLQQMTATMASMNMNRGSNQDQDQGVELPHKRVKVRKSKT